MNVRPASPADIAAVVAHMREADRFEVMNARFSSNPADVAEELQAAMPMTIALYSLGLDTTPIALMGAWLVAPRVAGLQMIATDRWPSIAHAATRFAMRQFIPKVLAPNVNRGECRCWAGHHVARRWMQRLGFVEEGLLRQYGNDGGTYVQMAWLNPDPAPYFRPEPAGG